MTIEWYAEWQRMTTTGTIGDNEWSSKWQRVTINDNQWQRMTASDKTNE